MKRHEFALLLLPLGVVGCARQPPSLPFPVQVSEYRIPWENAFPSDVAVDSVGRVWFTDRLTHVIGRYDPESRTFERYPTPTPKSAPYGLVSTPDGVLWFAESTAGRLGKVDVATGEIQEVPLPDLGHGGPHLLAYSGNRIWFTAREAGRWGWYDPATGAAASFPFTVKLQNDVVRRTPSVRPYSIAAAPGGGVWIGTYDSYFLLRAWPGVDTLVQRALSRELAPDTAFARRITGVPDSVRIQVGRRFDRVGARRSTTDGRGTLWIADFLNGRVIRFRETPDTFVSYRSLERTAGPYGIAVDPWGRVWYDELRSGNLVVLNPRTGERTLIPVAHSGAAIRYIAFDKQRKRAWLPISDAGLLGMVQLR